MKAKQKCFVIIDDDPQNNLLSKMALRKSFGDIDVKDFVVPEKGLEYIRSEFAYEPGDEKTTVFLDLNMPTMSGWEFLEKFERFDEPLKKQFDIYILSSTVDPRDHERVKLNPLVIDLIEKPLNKRTVLKILAERAAI